MADRRPVPASPARGRRTCDARRRPDRGGAACAEADRARAQPVRAPVLAQEPGRQKAGRPAGELGRLLSDHMLQTAVQRSQHGVK